eukprot:TRINITY_DN11926_c0_g1_i2.p1 TRINITY_DN11926_c0_g1~~TRINITY_DN11926_c0_g1_i2.p1  ORF type:complete len:295 (+),score=51.90 TRINITY_DN11926_c0_g1_i2:126-1010(+)
MSLLQKLKEVTTTATALGVLQTFASEINIIKEQGANFRVAYLPRLLESKQAASAPSPAGVKRDPFDPPDADLVVTPVSHDHIFVLNKYNVVPLAGLVVTKAVESQQTHLTVQNIEAMWQTMVGIDGFGFYNGGKGSGSSQPHKHMQVVPNESVVPPIGIWVPEAAAAQPKGQSFRLPQYPVRHRVVMLPDDILSATHQDAAKSVFDSYKQLLHECALVSAADADLSAQPLQTPYNFICTQQWCIVIPRSAENDGSIAYNSLGVIGTLIVRDMSDLQRLQSEGVLASIQRVCFPE